MAILVRFVQHYHPDRKPEFMKLEREFARLERRQRKLPRGERLISLAGREPANTLIWQSHFENLRVAEQALKTLEKNTEHQRLYEKQVPYIEDVWIEFYEVLEL